MTRTKVYIKKPKIRERKIKDEGVLGWAYQDDFEIEIDPRQSSKEYCNTILHEVAHVWFPDLSERQVIKFADILTDILWSRNYRRVLKGKVRR
jgi:uncharacterized protein Veg